MSFSISNDLDTTINKIREEFQKVNPNKKFTKEGILFYAIGNTPEFKNILNTSSDVKIQRITKKIPNCNVNQNVQRRY